MDAPVLVGRVGGLAVALGVGAALFSGSGAAWADRSGADAGGDTSSASSAAADSVTPSGPRARRGGASPVGDSGNSGDDQPVRGRPRPAAAVDAALPDAEPSASQSRSAATESVPAPEPLTATGTPAATATSVEQPVAAVAGPAAAVPQPNAPAASRIVDPVLAEPQIALPAPETAPAGTVSGFLSAATAPSDGAGSGPALPTDSPLSWSVLAFSRGQIRPAAGVTTIASQQPVAALTADTAAPPNLADCIGSVIFDGLQALTKLVVGPPKLPAGSPVTVRSTTLQISGHSVDADWYFPAGDAAPTGVIYLQHGVLATGPMYSYTAAYLAEKTNSVVVAPTLSSNLFADDEFWLGGPAALQGVAALFQGDRAALTASAVSAGYAEKYGQTTPLPTKFVLAGHSLGGTTASGAADYYAQAVNGTGIRNDLAGVILFDATAGTVLPAALVELNKLDRYVPLFEIGAPRNSFDMLTENRPDKFNGVVVDGGVHMDSMQGGNPLIEFFSHLFAGFPQPQNPPAVQELAAGWISDMFAGRIAATDSTCSGDGCQGIYGPAGATVHIDTDKGTATAVVIGSPAAGSASSATGVIGLLL